VSSAGGIFIFILTASRFLVIDFSIFILYIIIVKERKEKMKKYNESSGLEFSYRGTEFPTQDMIDWFNYESDIKSKQENEFFEEFKNELMDMSYFQMLDIFKKARDKKY